MPPSSVGFYILTVCALRYCAFVTSKIRFSCITEWLCGCVRWLLGFAAKTAQVHSWTFRIIALERSSIYTTDTKVKLLIFELENPNFLENFFSQNCFVRNVGNNGHSEEVKMWMTQQQSSVWNCLNTWNSPEHLAYLVVLRQHTQVQLGQRNSNVVQRNGRVRRSDCWSELDSKYKCAQRSDCNSTDKYNCATQRHKRIPSEWVSFRWSAPIAISSLVRSCQSAAWKTCWVTR